MRWAVLRVWVLLVGLLLLGGCAPPGAAGPGGGCCAVPPPGGSSVERPACAAPVAPPLGVVVTPDLHLTQVVPSLGADLAGLRPGDLLLAVDDHTVTTVADAHQQLVQAAARRAGPCNDTVAIEIDRAGRVLGRSTPRPAPADRAGIPIRVRRGTEDLTLAVSLVRPAQPTPDPAKQPFL